MSARTKEAALMAVPLLGGVLVALASRHEELYRFLVREDSLLEWAQVVGYGAVVALGCAGSPRLWRGGDRIAAVVAAVLACLALVSIGEELAWGQRVIGFGTPELFAENQQGETTLHNDSRLELPSRLALLFAGLYGVLASFVFKAPTSLAPPRALAGFFAAVALYVAFRLLVLEHPSYVEAKYSEWPEFCLAFAVACWCAALVRRSDPSRAGARPGRAGLGEQLGHVPATPR